MTENGKSHEPRTLMIPIMVPLFWREKSVETKNLCNVPVAGKRLTGGRSRIKLAGASRLIKKDADGSNEGASRATGCLVRFFDTILIREASEGKTAALVLSTGGHSNGCDLSNSNLSTENLTSRYTMSSTKLNSLSNSSGGLNGTQTQTSANGSCELTTSGVASFLKVNPQFLENYVISSAVSRETFQRWQSRRALRDSSPSGASSKNVQQNALKKRSSSNAQPRSDEWKLENHFAKRKLLLDLSTDAENGGNKNQLLYELMAACVHLVFADGGHLYLIDKDAQELYFYDSDKTGEPQPSRRFRPRSGHTVAAYVASKLETVRSMDVNKDTRFPDGIGVPGLPCQSVLCQPLIDPSGVVWGVIELYRSKTGAPFSDKEEETISLLTVWGCLGIYFSQLFHSMNKQRKLNDFLLTVTKSIFQDIVSMDTVIMKVMNFAQKLVSADRASLFLVDNKSNELYARIFDVGTAASEAGNLDSNGQKEIRFPMDRGIAGFVASTGHVLNIEDAYTDERFNREVDLKTGYVTKTILCMPIFIRGTLIGVVQMVNKQNGTFLKHDEEAFETFAIYCGLALHHAKLYDKIRRSEQKYRVALEVLAYHSVCSRDEIQKLKRHPMPDRIIEVETFDFNALSLGELEKPLYAVYMFKDLFGLTKFDYDELVRFVLTVRKNYRRVAYHNWTHGWSVAHAMYVILKSSDAFTQLEGLAMFVASLCHDLDHRGKNNAYMKNMSTPLASIYSTSVMEHHHFNQTVTILQQEGHNIFRTLSSEDYKWVLGNIKHCILATDLALFFPNRAKLKKLIDEEAFFWENKDQRLIVQAVAMTACDLIASAKPWEVQTDTTKVIFEEFYEQGDAERANGRDPIPMMDRTKAHELPQMQVGFMSGICNPCYDTLAHVLPCVQPLVERAKFNQSKWQELADEQKRRLDAREAKNKGGAGEHSQ